MTRDAQFGSIASLLQARSGVAIPPRDAEVFAARLREYMERRRLRSEADLLQLVRNSGGDYEDLLEALLAAPCQFFRSGSVFDAFQRRVLPEMHMKKFWDKPRSLRLWCAGCGQGEEAYSLALLVAEALELSNVWNVHLLATDVRARAIEHAQRGVYPVTAIEHLRPECVERYFARVGNGHVMVKPRLRSLVSFARMNLAELDYPGRFDCIFCVDVLPYLLPECAAGFLRRCFEYLEPGGYLFLGPEPFDSPVRFAAIKGAGTVLWQKPAAATLRSSLVGVAS